VERGIIRESYLLRPFAEKSNGARTKITTTLNLISKSSAAIVGKLILSDLQY